MTTARTKPLALVRYICLLLCVIASVLFVHVKLSNAYQKSLSSKPSPIVVQVNPYTTAAVPQGWKLEKIADLSPHSVYLSGRRGWVLAYLFTNADIRVGKFDSRRPRYFARHYAHAWHLPYRQWATHSATQVYETQDSRRNKTLYIASLVSPYGEAQILADLTGQKAVAEARKAIRTLLATSLTSKGHRALFPGMSLSPPELQRLDVDSLRTSGISEQLGRYSILLPRYWYPDDLVFPNPFGYDVDSAQRLGLDLYLVVPKHAYEGSLMVRWSGTEDDASLRKKRQTIARSYQNYKRRGIPSRQIPLPGQLKCKAFNVPVSGGRHIIYYFYSSKTLAVQGIGATTPGQPIQMHDSAMADIIVQLTQAGSHSRKS